MQISNPGVGILTVAETEVFSGSKDSTWADLDLSAVVGPTSAEVMLKVAETGNVGSVWVSVRKNGDTDDFSGGTNGQVAHAYALQNSAAFVVLKVATDATGKIEWKLNTTGTVTVDVMDHII